MKPICGIKVKLVGEDGNAFFIMGKVMCEMLKAGCDEKIVCDFEREVNFSDYDKLLSTCAKYIKVI